MQLRPQEEPVDGWIRRRDVDGEDVRVAALARPECRRVQEELYLGSSVDVLVGGGLVDGDEALEMEPPHQSRQEDALACLREDRRDDDAAEGLRIERVAFLEEVRRPAFLPGLRHVARFQDAREEVSHHRIENRIELQARRLERRVGDVVGRAGGRSGLAEADCGFDRGGQDVVCQVAGPGPVREPIGSPGPRGECRVDGGLEITPVLVAGRPAAGVEALRALAMASPVAELALPCPTLGHVEVQGDRIHLVKSSRPAHQGRAHSGARYDGTGVVVDRREDVRRSTTPAASEAAEHVVEPRRMVRRRLVREKPRPRRIRQLRRDDRFV
mmetsp:Transcript_24009/g.77252  ORF Transcript_24009/g.77252 Transcript_24009/m.77252 type:complete len:328 (-) Transcript_24009:1527-2510(-)